jgi:hypothetical protein
VPVRHLVELSVTAGERFRPSVGTRGYGRDCSTFVIASCLDSLKRVMPNLQLVPGDGGPSDDRDVPKSSAIYLVGDGPYREPRLIELQYLRVLRYANALGEKLKKRFGPFELFVDLAFPRAMDAEDVPSLMRLVGAIENGAIGTVFLDLQIGRPYSPYENQPVVNTLRKTNVRIYNAYHDDEDAISDKVRGLFRGKVPYFHGTSDAEDIVTLFPGLAASVAREAICLGDRCGQTISAESISSELHNLGTENPYNASSLPLLSARRHHEMWKRADEMRKNEYAKRRLSEPLFLLRPDEEGKLRDEDVWNGETRDDQQLEWALHRLCDQLGFTSRVSGQATMYAREIEGDLVVADRRRVGAIEFGIYHFGVEERRDKRRQVPPPSWHAHGHFSLPDRFKHNIETKFFTAFKGTRRA